MTEILAVPYIGYAINDILHRYGNYQILIQFQQNPNGLPIGPQHNPNGPHGPQEAPDGFQRTILWQLYYGFQEVSIS